MNNQVEYEQPTSAPVPKVSAAIAAGGLVAAVNAILALVGVTVPDGLNQQATEAVTSIIILAGLVSTAIPVIAAYLKKDAKPPAAINIIKQESQV